MAGVKTTHPDYDRLSPLWQRCRDAVAGQDAIHKAGEKYLPKLKAEDKDDYAARLQRSDFFNATWRTISGLTGMAFRKPPVANLPPAIEKWTTDIDLGGVNLDALAEQVVEEVLEVGRVGLLVDHPPIEKDKAGKVVQISQAVAEAKGQRPSIQLYPTETIRNWKFGRVANKRVLTMVVLCEKASIPKDEFEDKAEDRYRVLDLDKAGAYRQRVFKVEDGKDILVEGPLYPVMGGNPLDYIPFLIVGRSGKGDMPDEPPLIDLVDANIAWYQINSTHRHTLYFCPPTFYITGVVLEENQTITVGGTSALVLPDPNSKVGYAEPSGTLVPELRATLADKKQEMAVLGARMIADETRQVETLGATQIKRTGENSILARIVIATSEAIEAALGIMAQWAGVGNPAVSYQVNRDFAPAMLGPQELTALVAAWQNGALSEAELYEVLQRGDVIDAAKPFEEHQEEAEAQVVVVKPAANEGIAA